MILSMERQPTLQEIVHARMTWKTMDGAGVLRAIVCVKLGGKSEASSNLSKSN